MSTLHNIIIRPLSTAKTTQLAQDNKVVFEVQPDASKYQVKAAVETLFKVKVARVNTLLMPSKPKRYGRHQTRRSGFKKAIITLAPGHSIDLFALGESQEEDEIEAGGDE